MKKVMVSADALHQVLVALNGPDYLIRELQAIRTLGSGPIDTLIKEYNTALTQYTRTHGEAAVSHSWTSLFADAGSTTLESEGTDEKETH